MNQNEMQKWEDFVMLVNYFRSICMCKTERWNSASIYKYNLIYKYHIQLPAVFPITSSLMCELIAYCCAKMHILFHCWQFNLKFIISPNRNFDKNTICSFIDHFPFHIECLRLFWTVFRITYWINGEFRCIKLQTLQCNRRLSKNCWTKMSKRIPLIQQIIRNQL